MIKRICYYNLLFHADTWRHAIQTFLRFKMCASKVLKYSNVICWCYSQVHQPQGLGLCDSFLSHKVSARALVHIGWIWLTNAQKCLIIVSISADFRAVPGQENQELHEEVRKLETSVHSPVGRSKLPIGTAALMMTVVDLPCWLRFVCSEHSDREPIEFWLNIQVWTYSLALSGPTLNHSDPFEGIRAGFQKRCICVAAVRGFVSLNCRHHWFNKCPMEIFWCDPTIELWAVMK